MDNILRLPEDLDDDAHTAEIARTMFVVKDLATADWCIRKAKEAEGRMAARKALVEDRIRRYREWLEAENNRDERTVESMALFLEPWVMRELSGGKRRSVNLPNGTAGFRRQPDVLDIIDEKEAMEWAQQHAPTCIVIKESLSKSALKAHIEQHGEVPPGVNLRAGADKFYIDVKKED